MEKRSKKINFFVGAFLGLFVGLLIGLALENVFAFLVLSALISVGLGALIVFDPNRTTHPEDTIFK